MATYNKFDSFIEDVFKKTVDVSTDTLRIALFVPGAPTPPDRADNVVDTTTATCTLKATTNILEIAAGNGYTKKGTSVSITTSSQTLGLFTLAASQVVFTASGGPLASLRYVVLYSDSAKTSATRPPISWWDYGSTIAPADGETLTVKFNNASPGTIFTAQ